MNRIKSFTRPLTWLTALLLSAFVAGCGGGSDSVPPSSAKAFTAYSLAGNVGTINEAAKTIAVTVPFNTNVTALVATFTTSAGASVKVGATAQVSGTTPNDFTTAKAYIVTAADASTATYTVTVTVAANSAKAITAYSLAVGATTVTGTINEAAKTIAVTVPFGTNVTALVATFSSTGSNVTVGGVAQVSGTTPNDFTAAKAYTVTAADASTAIYTVTVTVAANSAKAITAFSFTGFAGNAGVITGAASPFAIAVSLPSGTGVTALVAKFTTTGANVKIGAVTQVSETTPNDFTTAKAYIVTAADATTATYNVTVTVAAPAANPAVVNLLTAGDFVILANTAITGTPTSLVTGDVGISPGAAAAITGFTKTLDATGTFWTAPEVPSPGKIYASDNSAPTPAKMTTAQTDMLTAYNDAAGRTAGTGSFLDAGASGDIGGLTLPRGVYTWATNGNVSISSNVTLNGSATDVWIFQIPGTLTQAAATSVTLTGGALPKNVFWQVAGGATIDTTAHMEGVILSATAITLNAGATANSRLLAQSAVTVDATVTQPAP